MDAPFPLDSVEVAVWLTFYPISFSLFSPGSLLSVFFRPIYYERQVRELSFTTLEIREVISYFSLVVILL